MESVMYDRNTMLDLSKSFCYHSPYQQVCIYLVDIFSTFGWGGSFVNCCVQKIAVECVAGLFGLRVLFSLKGIALF